MEPRGARQRPGRPCQLIWPQAQPYSITTSAVNIQLRVVSALLPASFSRLLKMTVVLETPRSSQAWWVHVPVTALCGRQVSLGTRAGRSCPHPRGSHTTGAVRENARSSCHLSGCQADLIGWVGVPFFHIAPKSFSSCTSPSQRKKNILAYPPRPLFYSTPRSDLKCNDHVTDWFNCSKNFPNLGLKVLHDLDKDFTHIGPKSYSQPTQILSPPDHAKHVAFSLHSTSHVPF